MNKLFRVKVCAMYNKKIKAVFEVSEKCTLEELDKRIKKEFVKIRGDPFDFSYPHLSEFRISNKRFSSWEGLEEDGYERRKGLQQKGLSNNPFHFFDTEGTFDKTLYQLFRKDGIWKFKYIYDMGDWHEFTVEIKDLEAEK